jgi:hypothetical protein
MKQTTKMNNFNNILKGGIFFIALSLTTTSCDLFRKAGTTNAPKKDTKKDKDEPTLPKDKTVLVDTIKWKIDPKAKPPILTTGTQPTQPNVITDNNGQPIPTPTNPNGTSETKSSYTMAMLLPFNSDKYTEGANPAKAQFALDFYAGAKLALDSLSSMPLNLTVNVLDSKGDFNNVANRYEVSKADVIIGPVDKEGVVSAIAYSERNNVAVVSPYFPTGDVDGTNPNFIQVKPSLKTHCMNIIKHLESHYAGAQVVLAARVKDNEASRFAYFDEANRMYSSSKYEEWKVEDDFAFNVEPYIANGRTTIFVIPSWNEAFVTTFLKKLNSSPRKNQIVVYGMPQWMDFDKGLNPLYENLKVRVSSSTYIESGSPDVKYFKNKFLAKYGKLPNSDSFLGYDCTLFTGKMMMQYGSKFPYFLDREQQSVLHTRFYFSPVFRASTTGNDTNDNISKYENSYVNILRFQSNAFRLDD